MKEQSIIKGQVEKELKIKDEVITIKPHEYYIFNQKNAKETILLTNNKLKELALHFKIFIENIDYPIATLNEKQFEYICKVTVIVEGQRFFGIGETNELNIDKKNTIAMNYRATMASIRAEGRAIVNALKFLGLEGDFYSEMEFEININSDNNSSSETNDISKLENKKKLENETIDEYIARNYNTIEEIENYIVTNKEGKKTTIKEMRNRPALVDWYRGYKDTNKRQSKMPVAITVGKLIDKLYELENIKKEEILRNKNE